MIRAQSYWLQGMVKRLAGSAIDLLFPAHCLACHTELNSPRDRIGYCRECCDEMARGNWPVCRRCASRVPKTPGAASECGQCRNQKYWFDGVFALGDYDGLLREQALAMKTDRSERIANAIGKLVATRYGKQLRDLRLDGIVPIPMHPWRRLVRGSNSPVALASSMGRELAIPTFTRLLYRQRNSRPQIGLSQPARFRNVRGEMQFRKSYQFQQPHLLLVDDVLTTGATCSEAARILKRAGAARVTVAVAARTAGY